MIKAVLTLSAILMSSAASATGGARGASVYKCELGGTGPESSVKFQVALEDNPSGWTNAMPVAIFRGSETTHEVTQLNVCLSPSTIKIDMNLPKHLADGAGLVCGDLIENPYRFLTPVQSGWLGVVRTDGIKLNFTLRKFKRETGHHDYIEEYNLTGSCDPVLTANRTQKK